VPLILWRRVTTILGCFFLNALQRIRPRTDAAYFALTIETISVARITLVRIYWSLSKKMWLLA